ncbi:Pyruvate kinase [Aduncisulcus paluster]|uniref:Pyruvate kinase n=1 Tax=Aduncisulcus paluster TaxID=2918883 RepID=A0ABQ5KLY2_9EUKA|nr:Pyruvate kinase [Aduncisulcus paluster]|eukprot:gnl/Carplike_NY0171/3522_a4757_419.p1 GENE.gnl/Carplike_NY0171/3522_a4757_419~~gnl/Carplike_NY0171/3522_a4757_419.p1  ORF type:complete len:542 (-),score=133.30 gnl/Carplike_NY0171/3522_a4757_419:77-1702(-)
MSVTPLDIETIVPPVKPAARTKIVATIGPACNTESKLLELFSTGVDVFRLNFSHGEFTEKAEVISILRKIEGKSKKPLTIMADLPGPKLRICKFEMGQTMLENGSLFTFDSQVDVLGTDSRIAVDSPEIFSALKVGDRILLDDGHIQVSVTEAFTDKCVCKVISGGPLKNRKGFNLPDSPLPASIPTEQDKEIIKFVLTQDIDAVALSFVQTPDDVSRARELIGDDLMIISKLEKPTALERKNLESIIDLSDGIMIARGDMGIEADVLKLALYQKDIASICRLRGKPCIIATMMLDSMTKALIPTRAEICDTANAVLDLSDATMLSAETAVGKHPNHVVSFMESLLSKTERSDHWMRNALMNRKQLAHTDSPKECGSVLEDHTPVGVVHSFRESDSLLKSARLIISKKDHKYQRDRIADSMAQAAVLVGEAIPARVIALYAHSLRDVQRISRLRPNADILAMTSDQHVARGLNFMWGVHPVFMTKEEYGQLSYSKIVDVCKTFPTRLHLLKDEEKIVFIGTKPIDVPNTYNRLRILNAKVE